MIPTTDLKQHMPRPTALRRHPLAALLLAFLIGIPVALSAQSPPKLSVELEVGPVWQSRNDVQIPNDASGTRFSLVDIVDNGPWLATRVNLIWNVNDRHSIRALLAPLSISESGVADAPVRFAGQTFDPDTPTHATYQFNSWRLSYRYQFFRSQEWSWWVGGTAKVRDAKIELRQGTTSAKDTDVGFVPLLHLAGEWRFSERWRALLDLDALAGGPGRAIDLGLKVGFDVNDQWTLTAGYRTVEGGADTDDVYSFAWFHAAVFSGIYRF